MVLSTKPLRSVFDRPSRDPSAGVTQILALGYEICVVTPEGGSPDPCTWDNLVPAFREGAGFWSGATQGRKGWRENLSLTRIVIIQYCYYTGSLTKDNGCGAKDAMLRIPSRKNFRWSSTAEHFIECESCRISFKSGAPGGDAGNWVWKID